MDSFPFRITIPACALLPRSQSFSMAAPGSGVIPVYRQLLGDRLTPVARFEVLRTLTPARSARKRHRRRRSDATAVATARSGHQVSEGNAAVLPGSARPQETARHFRSADPRSDLIHLLPQHRYRQDPHLPAFTGGLVSMRVTTPSAITGATSCPGRRSVIGGCPITFSGYTPSNT